MKITCDDEITPPQLTPAMKDHFFRDGYSEGTEDRVAKRLKKQMCGELGAGYEFGFVGDYEPMAALDKWKSYARPIR